MTDIKRLYFNPKFSGSFSGISSFISNRKLTKSKKEVELELLKHPAYYFYRPARRVIKKRRPVVVHLPNFQLVADLIDVQRLAKENKGYRFILVAIDGFSRKLYAVPLKDKKGDTLVTAFKKIFKDIPRTIRYLQTDDGTEFTNIKLQDLLKSRGIIWFSTYSAVKASLAERVISTLMTRLSRIFTHQGNNQYLKVLQSVVQAYNSTIHSSTGVAPNKVTSRNQDSVWERLYGKLIDDNVNQKPKFKVGDKVRLSVVKSTFTKGYMPRYTQEEFEVTKIQDTIPLTYVVKDSQGEIIKGSFYVSELLSV